MGFIKESYHEVQGGEAAEQPGLPSTNTGSRTAAPAPGSQVNSVHSIFKMFSLGINAYL